MAGTTPEAAPRATRHARPLSPHWQIYRWPVTMVTSILHRFSGMANAGALVVVTIWLLGLAMGPEVFGLVHDLLATALGRLILFGMTLAAGYHLFNGIRHLTWDTGAGFGLKTASFTGYLVFALTILFTLALWVAGYWFAGAFA